MSESTYRESPTISSLAAALAKAQGEIRNAPKDSANPYYHSRYADLAAVWDVIRKPLSENGLCVLQPFAIVDKDVIVTTKLLHASGEFIEMSWPIPAVDTTKEGKERFDAQTMGKAVTYGRRYGLQAIVGVAGEDDDGNSAADAAKKNGQNVRDNGLKILKAAVVSGTDTLRLAWEKTLTEAMRIACKNDLEGLKAEAKKRDAEITAKSQERQPGDDDAALASEPAY